MSRCARVFLFLLAVQTLSACGTQDVEVSGTNASSKASTRVMTFNVLCSFCVTREHDPWAQRLEYFRDIFARHDPDLIGVQELSPPPISVGDEVQAILDRAPGRSAIFFQAMDGRSYPDAAILYRSSRYSEVEHGTYWLSPTPDEPYSNGFARVQFPRLVVWARLMDLERGREIFFASTHFDNNSPSQERSAPLVLERTRPFVANEPVIFVGDFNSRPDSRAYALLTGDTSQGFAFRNAFDLVSSPALISNHDPRPAFDVTDRIDHIFLAGEGVSWQVGSWAADLSVYGPNDRLPSDHFPVVADVSF